MAEKARRLRPAVLILYKDGKGPMSIAVKLGLQVAHVRGILADSGIEEREGREFSGIANRDFWEGRVDLVTDGRSR